MVECVMGDGPAAGGDAAVDQGEDAPLLGGAHELRRVRLLREDTELQGRNMKSKATTLESSLSYGGQGESLVPAYACGSVTL